MHPSRFFLATLVLAAALGLASCTGNESDDGATGPPSGPASDPPVTPAERSEAPASPTPPSLPDEPPRTRGPIALDCEQGWVTPRAGSPRFNSPLGVIRRTTRVRGPLEVVDMRYFEGPESPPTDKGYLLVVQRWYVKAYAPRDLAFQGRFLVEARRFGQGVAAVAPYDTNGFRSPDWVAFEWEGGQEAARAYEGLPGTWPGKPYDFVRGGERLPFPGLPEQVIGCLDAT